MCKVSFADNSETVGHTGIARLCCSQRTARTRTDCLLLQEEAPASSGGGGCHHIRWNDRCLNSFNSLSTISKKTALQGIVGRYN